MAMWISLLLLLVLVSRLQAAAQPYVTVLWPPGGAVLSLEEAKGLVVRLQVRDFVVPHDGYIHVSSEKLLRGFLHTTNSTSVTITQVDVGSHFLTFALVYHNGLPVENAPTATLHMEVVLMQSPQVHRPRVYLTREVAMNPNNEASSVDDKDFEAPRRFCFVANPRGFDGQKKIWLQVLKALPRPKWQTTFFSLTDDQNDHGPFLDALQALGVSIQRLMLLVDNEELLASGVETRSEAVLEVCIQAYENALNASSRKVSSRNLVLSINEIQRLQPPFVARLWEQQIRLLKDSCEGGILLIDSSCTKQDKFRSIAGRVAGVAKIVQETPNLSPFPVEIDALIAPSYFALNHPNVVRAVKADHRYMLFSGVDTELFRPRSPIAEPRTSFTVGYVGRLATEKSVGFVMMMARALSISCPTMCSVVIIGDGDLRPHLESLAYEWRIHSFVHFKGSIFDEQVLVTELQQLDVFVSPGLQETLGIAPLEAMSCGIPVVGFASAGVGEYLEDRVNGLVVRKPSGEAFRDAVMELYHNRELMERLGTHARQTVERRFSLRRGVADYVALYERLVRPATLSEKQHST